MPNDKPEPAEIDHHADTVAALKTLVDAQHLGNASWIRAMGNARLVLESIE